MEKQLKSIVAKLSIDTTDIVEENPQILVNGKTVDAKQIFCASAGIAENVLDSLNVIVPKWWVKLIIGLLKNAIEDVAKEICVDGKCKV